VQPVYAGKPVCLGQKPVSLWVWHQCSQQLLRTELLQYGRSNLQDDCTWRTRKIEVRCEFVQCHQPSELCTSRQQRCEQFFRQDHLRSSAGQQPVRQLPGSWSFGTHYSGARRHNLLTEVSFAKRNPSILEGFLFCVSSGFPGQGFFRMLGPPFLAAVFFGPADFFGLDFFGLDFLGLADFFAATTFFAAFAGRTPTGAGSLLVERTARARVAATAAFSSALR